MAAAHKSPRKPAKIKQTDDPLETKGGLGRTKRVYEHEMTGADRFALSTVLKAKKALTSVAVAIQEGRQCNADLVKAALAVQTHAADLLFGV